MAQGGRANNTDQGVPMSRVQLALNVDDVDQAVEFYSKLFNTKPAKRRPGYANFAISEPPLKLVLLENTGTANRLNHLGVEVDTTDEVAAHQTRLAAAGVAPSEEHNTTCCYAVQDKFWVNAPDGEQWEHYVVLADANPELEGQSGGEASLVAGDGACCTTEPDGSMVCC
jgi:catechol 2,3-dioxygenase-like lactoylglutathione lyase family enzyme